MTFDIDANGILHSVKKAIAEHGDKVGADERPRSKFHQVGKPKRR